jgi:transcription initiation factor TFIIIB Brf1 subunit/transcription initiation factor TFIIB
MTDFSLFEQALTEYEKVSATINDTIDDETEEIIKISPTGAKCLHLNVINEKGIVLCTECGEEIYTNITHEKEWRYYGVVDNKNTTDPNRVQLRKFYENNIYKDVENMGFSEKIIATANQIYLQVTKGNIKRGNSRKAIVFACVFQSFKLNNCPQTHERLIQIFELSRKTGLQGLKHVALNAPKDSEIHTTHITPIHLVKEIMAKFDAPVEQVNEVIEIYEKIKNKDTKLNRARPQSTACGIIYLYICLKKKDISLKEFAKKVGLSELTIGKMAKLVAEILGIPEVIE